MATAIATFNWRKTIRNGFLRKAKHARYFAGKQNLSRMQHQ